MFIRDKEINNIDSFQIRLLYNVECYEHTHYRAEIAFVKKGAVTVKCNQIETVIPEGTAIIILPYELHAYKSEDETETIIMEFDRMLFHELTDNIDIKNRITKIDTASADYITAMLSNKRQDEIYIKSVVYSVLNNFPSLHTNPASVSFSDKNIFYAALDYIENSFSEKISLKTASVALGYSYSHLSRVFSAFTGISFTAYLNRFRILKSLDDLAQTDMSISEISYRNGFETLRSYNREFQKVFHMTPGEYRKIGYKLIEDCEND